MSFTDKKNIPADDKTMIFSLRGDKDREIREILQTIYDALKEKGYKKPIDQIAGYILSEDPTYITNYKNARVLTRKIDRDELLRVLLQNYLTL